MAVRRLCVVQWIVIPMPVSEGLEPTISVILGVISSCMSVGLYRTSYNTNLQDHPVAENISATVQ